MAGDFLGQALVQAAVVADPGQLVAAGQRPERFVAGPQPARQQQHADRDHGQADRLDQSEDEGLALEKEPSSNRQQQTGGDRDQSGDEKAGPDRAAVGAWCDLVHSEN